MPPSLRYINQSAPFWDFIASMENSEHPLFGGAPNNQDGHPPPGPWAQGPWGGRHSGHRGWWNHQNMAHRGPPGAAQDASGPHASEQATAAESPATMTGDEQTKEKDVQMENKDIPDPPEDTPGEPGEDGHCGRRRCHGRRHHNRGESAQEGSGCEGRRGGRGWHHRGPPFHPYGGPRGGPHGHHRGGLWSEGWEGFGPRGFRMLSNLFGQQGNQETGNGNESGDWAPEADVFDTPGAFVIHVSLPGANKEDVGVTWDSERSELQIAGVVHRPGDEEFLKTLAMDERKVGAFERKVRLGTRAHPAQVDVDGVSAKLENGILIVEVPKMLEEFVEVKKVDIE